MALSRAVAMAESMRSLAVGPRLGIKIGMSHFKSTHSISVGMSGIGLIVISTALSVIRGSISHAVSPLKGVLLQSVKVRWPCVCCGSSNVQV